MHVLREDGPLVDMDASAVGCLRDRFQYLRHSRSIDEWPSAPCVPGDVHIDAERLVLARHRAPGAADPGAVPRGQHPNSRGAPPWYPNHSNRIRSTLLLPHSEPVCPKLLGEHALHMLRFLQRHGIQSLVEIWPELHPVLPCEHVVPHAVLVPLETDLGRE